MIDIQVGNFADDSSQNLPEVVKKIKENSDLAINHF